MENAFPGNSNSGKGVEATEKIEKVIVGTVVTRKKPISRRIRETFMGNDARGVGEYVFSEVLVPAAKDMIVDSFTQFMERMFYNEPRSALRSSRFRGSPYTPYRQASHDPRRREQQSRGPSRRGRALHNFDEFIMATRGEASLVLDALNDRIERFGAATVSDLYDMLGESGSYTDVNYGWTEIMDARITRVDRGYLLDLPSPEFLD